MPEDTSPILDGYAKVFIVILIIAVLFEATILGIAFFNADEVDCNFLWCSFKTTRGTSIMSEDCFQNGVRINCSGMHQIENITGWFNDYS